MPELLTIGAGNQRQRGEHLITCDHEGDIDDQRRPAWFTVASCVFAALVVLYHADNSVGQVIRGSAGDGAVSVQWEYDLEYGTGELLLRNINFELDPNGERLYFRDLIPYGSTEIRLDREVVELSQCTASAAIPIHAFAKLPPGKETQITFRLPPPSWTDAFASTDLEYGKGFVFSATACFKVPVAGLDNFVTIVPIDQACRVPDSGDDGDVDLRGFSEFLRRHEGRKE